MMRNVLILLAIPALAATAGAQEMIVRRAMPAGPVELHGGNLTFVLPTASLSKSVGGAWISRHSGQEAGLTYRPSADSPVLIRYTLGAQADDGYSNGRTSGWSRSVGLQQRPALAAEFTEKSSLELAMESRARFDQAMQEETAVNTELVLQTADVPGLNLLTRLGRADIRDATNHRKNQNYLSLSAEQKLPWVPVRVSVAPSVTAEKTPGVAGSEVLMTGVGTGLFLDAAANTTLSLRSVRNENPGPAGGVATRFRSFATQIEQRFLPTAAVRFQTSYEEQQIANLTTAAVFIGADSTFSLTDSITGALQLRQRAMQFLDAAGALPETVISFSLGGAF